jgi:hypothetical protein
MSKISINQINESQLNTFVQVSMSGAAFSGNLVNYAINSGYMGPTVVWTTGGAQDITGSKRFQDPVLVQYSGGTGAAPSARFVLDQDLILSGVLTGQLYASSSAGLVAASGTLAAQTVLASGILTTGISNASGVLQTAITANGTSITSLSGYVNGASGALSAVRVTGSSTIPIVNFTGLGGSLVIHSGDFVFISGSAGGGASNTSVTGSAAISAPNFTGVGTVVLTYDGTYVKVSGIAGADATLSGYVENSFVHRYGDESITGTKNFVASPLVPNATIGTQAINLDQLSGASGVLVAAQAVTNNYWITGTGVVTTSFNASGNINNTFSITSGNTYVYNTGVTTSTFTIYSGDASVSNSGTATNTFNTSGAATVTNNGTATNNFNGQTTNVTNLSGITGNFVNMSFWYDESNLSTGLNTIEAFISRSFYFTGYGLAVINTGTQGFFSGSFYQRTSTNAKTNFVDFSLNSGMFFTGVGGYNQEISGMNRVGLDIYRIGTGITGLSVGLFGVGY